MLSVPLFSPLLKRWTTSHSPPFSALVGRFTHQTKSPLIQAHKYGMGVAGQIEMRFGCGAGWGLSAAPDVTSERGVVSEGKWNHMFVPKLPSLATPWSQGSQNPTFVEALESITRQALIPLQGSQRNHRHSPNCL